MAVARALLGLSALALAGCASAPQSGSSVLPGKGRFTPEFAAVVAEVGPALPYDMNQSFGCMMDLSLASSMTNDSGDLALDSSTRSVYKMIGHIYRERVVTLEAEGQTAPAYATDWWTDAKRGTTGPGFVAAMQTYGEGRLAELDSAGDATVFDEANECRKQVADRLTEDQIRWLAFESVLQGEVY